MTDPVTRINALTANARSTWFALLSVLLFVGITLMGVEHIDFYGVDRATQLPLINVAVPTPLFFYAAPILTAAVYGYFHLYLIRLWDALGAAPARVNGDRLGDTISPWLVTDAALYLRLRLRGDNCATPRTMESASMLGNIALAWGFGPVILGFLWHASMPARQWEMTLIAGAFLLAALASGAASFAALILRMKHTSPDRSTSIWSMTWAKGVSLVLLPGILFYGYQSTSGSPDRLARLDLSGQDLVEHPATWLPYPIARKDFLATWCKRENITDCADLGDRQQEFDAEWRTRRSAALAALKKPHWNGSANGEPDLRGADLSRAFLAGTDLSEAQMQRSDLSTAQMEGTDFSGAQMEGADLSTAQMEGADLSMAQMQGAVLTGAQMQGAVLREAQMEGAVLWGAQMEGAVLTGAHMQGADFSGAQMEGAVLWGAQMQGADFSGAQMEEAALSRAQMEGAVLWGAKMQGADLWGAQMEGADLSRALLTGTAKKLDLLHSTNLSASTNYGGALRFMDLTKTKFDSQTDWSNAFFDVSVIVPPNWRAQIGQPCLWNWIATQTDPLSDEEFFGHWRGWLTLDPKWRDQNWQFIAPEPYHDVPILPPPTGCRWITQPLPAGQAEALLPAAPRP
ncbi:pentapeptide repeat-containing protein [Seohaeicola saemankumensis]|nr:pentapeptide repeat-containing protein [Seohaeicola saemankumensis]MCA0869707.1 pentapeptide repeat-containing protein [Seohaeicola saemankumensis]